MRHHEAEIFRADAVKPEQLLIWNKKKIIQKSAIMLEKEFHRIALESNSYTGETDIHKTPCRHRNVVTSNFPVRCSILCFQFYLFMFETTIRNLLNVHKINKEFYVKSKYWANLTKSIRGNH